MPLGRGAVRDDRSHPRVVAQLPFARLARKLGASSTPIGRADLSAFRSPMMDQNGWEGCTSFAAARACYQRAWVKGLKLPWIPSPVALWSDAILIDTSPVPDAATLAKMNVGVQSVSMMIAIGHGIRPMGPLADRFSDIITGPVSPGLDDLTTAAMHPQVGEYRIDEGASDWTEHACIALDHGVPIYIGMNVGPIYDDWVPSMPPIDTDEPQGKGAGHAVVLDAYETTQAGERIFRSPGSYGEGKADKGVWTFTARGLRARAFDVYPFEVG